MALAAGFLFWEMLKIGAAIAMLVIAARVVPHLSWPALLLAIQVITGVLLTFYYVPYPMHAYESVRQISFSVRFGSFCTSWAACSNRAWISLIGVPFW